MDTTKELEEMLGPPVDTSDPVLQKCREEGDFTPLAFELYKEAGVLIGTCGHLYQSDEPENAVLPRNQAICAGLLIRITKFMTVVIQLTASSHRGEVVMSLNRSICESTINLVFLLEKNEERWFDQFARLSLGPERELYDIIQVNIANRAGEVLPIEKRMLNSIEGVCKLTGIKIEEVDKKYRDWGGGLRDRTKAIGAEDLYTTLRTASHAVHGTWVDLMMNHLVAKEEGYVPEPSWTQVDARLMLPVAMVALRGAGDYLGYFFSSAEEAGFLLNRLLDLQNRIARVDDAEETFRNQG